MLFVEDSVCKMSSRSAASTVVPSGNRSEARSDAAAAGEIGENDRVVALVTGTGLKTPQAVAEHESGVVVEIDADVDALLDELGVTA